MAAQLAVPSEAGSQRNRQARLSSIERGGRYLNWRKWFFLLFSFAAAGGRTLKRRDKRNPAASRASCVFERVLRPSSWLCAVAAAAGSHDRAGK